MNHYGVLIFYKSYAPTDKQSAWFYVGEGLKFKLPLKYPNDVWRNNIGWQAASRKCNPSREAVVRSLGLESMGAGLNIYPRNPGLDD